MLTTLLEMVDTDGFDTSLIEGSRSLGALPSVAEGADGGGLAQPTLSSTAQESNVSAYVCVYVYLYVCVVGVCVCVCGVCVCV
jgi:hypothetical protein